MKHTISYRFFVLSIFLLFGCAGSMIERTVKDDNTFYSSNKPKIRIKINPDFIFVKKTDQTDSSLIPGVQGTGTNILTDRYIFTDRASGKARSVEIVIKELTNTNWYFKPDIFKEENNFDSSNIKIQGKNYQSCVYTVREPDNYLLIRGIGRLVGSNNNAMIMIFYIEKATGDWSNINLLTSEQKEQLTKFIESSKKDIQIIE